MKRCFGKYPGARRGREYFLMLLFVWVYGRCIIVPCEVRIK